jgi:glycosyltransferase involved in cell wall biosynthesis
MNKDDLSDDRSRAPRDAADLPALLRAAEAQLEAYESTVKYQETMAGLLGEALAVARQAQEQLDHQRVGVLRHSLHRLARRLLRRGSRGSSGGATGSPTSGTSRWSDTEQVINDDRYQLWISLYDNDPKERASLAARVADLADAPLISVLLPVYNTPDSYLREAIDSVLQQIYTKWELCIADDCSTEPHVAKILAEYAAGNDRIRVVRRPENGHISASSNSALDLARGSWVCLMDHDDLLPQHALAAAVIALEGQADAGMLYSDEDHISQDGMREVPYFKPDFDPLLLLGQNYFSHLSMMRTDLVRRVGGFRVGMEGSQDWDLVLRVVEQLRPSQIVHVPHVLYHWRSHPESTASSLAAKPYVVEASRQVVQEHLDRLGVQATAVNLRGSSFNRIKWALPPEPATVSIIVLPRSGTRFCRCLDSIRMRSTYPNLEIVVVDDGAFRPPMRQYLRDNDQWLRVIENRQDLSDSAQRNRAAASARGDVLCFVHDDVEVLTESWLEELLGPLSYPGIGAVGAKLLYPDLTIQHAGIVLGIGGTVGHPHRLHFDNISPGYFGRLMLAQCPSAVSSACMAVRRDAFEAIGGFNEDHFTGLFGEVDFCLRLNRAGWRTGWTPHAELIHFEKPEDSRATAGENAVRFDRDIRVLTSTWGNWLENDPAYNPNLSLAHESLPLAFPPRRTNH